MRSRFHLAAPLVATLAGMIGCGREEASPPAGPTPPGPGAPAPRTNSYTLKGVVREVDPASGVVTIAHEEIPGFMKAMTMEFTPTDRSCLAEVGPGDEVEGPLDVRMVGDDVKDYDLRGLTVTRAAPRTLSLDFGKGTATLAPQVPVLRPGEPVPDFAMTTQEGRPLRLSDLRGKVVVLTFIYTRCPLPDFCPAIDRKFRGLADRLGAVRVRSEAVRLLSVSFDFEHDNPEALRKHAELQGAKPPLWTFAVAAHAELLKVARPLGLTYGPMQDEIRHNLCTAVVAPDGTLARLESGSLGRSWTPEDLMTTIVRLIPSAP